MENGEPRKNYNTPDAADIGRSGGAGNAIALAICCDACCRLYWYSYLIGWLAPRRPVVFGYANPWARPRPVIVATGVGSASAGCLPNLSMARA